MSVSGQNLQLHHSMLSVMIQDKRDDSIKNSIVKDVE